MFRSGVVTILYLSFGSAIAFAGGRDCKYISMDDLAGKQVPQFNTFPAKPIPGLRPAPVNFQNNPKAKPYRTAISRGATKGPNFAGHFTIVGWGCGSSCGAWAVVDAKSGTVYFPPDNIATISTVHVDEIGPNEPEPLFHGLRFRLNSNLIRLLGAPSEDDSREGILFYRWTGKTFELIQAHKWCKQ